MITIHYICRVSNGQTTLTINKQNDYVFVGDRPEYTCSVNGNVNFLKEHPLRWERIQRDGSQSIISQLSTVQPGLESEFSVKSNTTDNGVYFVLRFSQGVKKNNDGHYRCVLYNKNNILLAEKKVEIHVIQLFKGMEFQVGDTRSEVPNASPLVLNLEEGTYTSVCKTSGSNPAASINIYLDSTELIGQTVVAAVDTTEIGPPKVYNVEKRNIIDVVPSDKDKILKCVSVLYNDSVIKEVISFKLHIHSAKPTITCRNTSAYNGARQISLTCFIKIDGVDCTDNIFWEHGETGKQYKEGGERKAYWVLCEERHNLLEVISTFHIDTVTEADFISTYFVVYVTKFKSVTRQQIVLYKDEMFVKKFTRANIVCPLIPDTNKSVSWNYGKKIVAIKNTLNPILGLENRFNVTHDIIQRQFHLHFLNFTKEDQGIYKCSAVANGTHTEHRVAIEICNIPDNNFVQVTMEKEILSYSSTTNVCSFQIDVQKSNTQDGETLHSGSFKLTILGPNAKTFDVQLSDQSTREETLTCLELNEDYCQIANKTVQTNIEWISREHIAAEDHQGIYMYIYSCNCNRSNIDDNSSCHFKDAAYFENYSWHLMDFKLSKADLFDCKIDLIKTSDNITVLFDKHDIYVTTLQYTVVGIAAAFSFLIIAVQVKIKRNGKSEHAVSTSPRESMQSARSGDQDNVYVDNEYEEIESVSYHSVNWRNYSFETNNKPSTANDESNNRPNSSNSGSDITMIHSYVNTNINNSNTQLNQSNRNESHSNRSNESVYCNTMTDNHDNRFSSASSECESPPVHQYVNIAGSDVQNSYEDLKHINDTQTYNTLQEDA